MIVDPQEQVIAPPPPELRWTERGAWEYANHYLAAINIPEEQLSSAMSAKLRSYAPTYNRHVRTLNMLTRHSGRPMLAWRGRRSPTRALRPPLAATESAGCLRSGTDASRSWRRRWRGCAQNWNDFVRRPRVVPIGSHRGCWGTPDERIVARADEGIAARSRRWWAPTSHVTKGSPRRPRTSKLTTVRVLPTSLDGPVVIEPVVHGDERGFFLESLPCGRARRGGSRSGVRAGQPLALPPRDRPRDAFPAGPGEARALRARRDPRRRRRTSASGHRRSGVGRASS